jgi:hypothetical protein
MTFLSRCHPQEAASQSAGWSIAEIDCHSGSLGSDWAVLSKMTVPWPQAGQKV